MSGMESSSSAHSQRDKSIAVDAEEHDTSAEESSDDDAAVPEFTECECSFCGGTYCGDGQVWVKCGCNNWVHEQCIEEVFLDDYGKERFCPFCLN